MPLMPSKLPLWAYAAAGAGAFVIARAARNGAGVVPAPPAAATDATPASAGSSGTSLWDVYGDSGSYGGQFSQTGGVFPGVQQPIPVTITDPYGNPQQQPPTSTIPTGTIPSAGSSIAPPPVGILTNNTAGQAVASPAPATRSAVAGSGAQLFRGSGSIGGRVGAIGAGSPVLVYRSLPAGLAVSVVANAAWGTTWYVVQGGQYGGYGFPAGAAGWSLR